MALRVLTLEIPDDCELRGVALLLENESSFQLSVMRPVSGGTIELSEIAEKIGQICATYVLHKVEAHGRVN